jgi:hypothetical protein
MRRLLMLAAFACSFSAMALATPQPSWGGLTVTRIIRQSAAGANNGTLEGGITDFKNSNDPGPLLQTASAIHEGTDLSPLGIPRVATAHGVAEQSSDISNTLLLSINADGRAQANLAAFSGAAYANARTYLEVRFTITDSPLYFVASGSTVESDSEANGRTATASAELLGATSVFSTSGTSIFGFSGALGPGNYVLWLYAESQAVSTAVGETTAGFDFDFVLQTSEGNLLPEPASTVSWLVLSLTFGAAVWRRKRADGVTYA